MSQLDSRTERKIAAQLQRVLIVDPLPAPARMLGDLLRSMGCQDLHWSVDQNSAFGTCGMVNPQIIFTEYSGPALDGLNFVRALRRSTLACRKSPVILATSEATALTITAARDAGVHEFLRKPYTIGDLTKRLEAVTLRKRSWIEAIEYIGPDRRRFNSAEYAGKARRRSDGQSGAPAERAKQALQILASAIGAIESDPMQAMRAMTAQVQDLRTIAAQTENAALAHAALQLDRALKVAARDGHISRPDLEACAKSLSQIMPATDTAADRLTA